MAPCRNDLRDAPTSSGRSSARSAGWSSRATSSQLCAACLANPMPGSTTIAPRGTPAATRGLHAPGQLDRDLRHDVGVGRAPIHVRGAPAHVHQHQGRPRTHGDIRDDRVAPQPADVVDHRGAHVHGGPRDGSLCRIHGDGDGHLLGQRRDDRLHTCPLDNRVDLGRARARGLPADVELGLPRPRPSRGRHRRPGAGRHGVRRPRSCRA